MDLPIIDAVYTWIDGSDKGRMRERAEWMSHLGKTESSRRLPLTPSKPKSVELYFSLQSLKNFTPWIRHIYIVTQRPQVPSWLAEFPRASVVHHDEIIDPTYLPTFSSRTIEANLHKIPGLSDHFIYLNDDMFLGRTLTPTDFFRHHSSLGWRPVLRTVKLWSPLMKNPPPSVYYTNKEEIQTVVQKKDNAYVNSNRRVHAFLNKTYVYDPLRPNIAHQATPLTKTLFDRAAQLLPDAWEDLQREKFRTSDTMTPIPLAVFVGFYEGKAVVLPKTKDGLIRVWGSASGDGSLMREVQAKTPHLFCINDLGPHMGPKDAQIYWKGLFHYLSK